MIVVGSTVLRLDFDIFSMRPISIGAPSEDRTSAPSALRSISPGATHSPSGVR